MLRSLSSWAELQRCPDWRQPVWVFKHSLTCPTSYTALAEFRAFAGDDGAETGCAVIEVQTARELSDELARRTGVRHESPQALLLHNDEAVWHASHWRIKADSLRQAAAASD